MQHKQTKIICTVAPGTRQTVKFTVVARRATHGGEYWGAVSVESLRHGTKRTVNEEEGTEATVAIVSTIIVPIFGTKGNVVYRGRLSEVGIQPLSDRTYVSVKIENTGTGRLLLDTDSELLDAEGKKVAEGQVPRTYVFRGSERVLRIPVDADLAEGAYTVRVTVKADQMSQPLQTEQVVRFNPPAEGSDEPEAAE